MKPHTLPVKRNPAPKGIFKRLSAVTRNRRQRVAAVADGDLDSAESGSKISRALTIIFLIHIMAIGLIFFHQKFLDDRAVEAPPAAPAPAPPEELPVLSQGDSPYIVQRGDNYALIATRNRVDEAELRRLNGEVEIRPGLILKVPPKKIVAMDPPELAAIRARIVEEPDSGLVEAVPAGTAPRAQLVKPKLPPPANTVKATPAAASGKTYVVRPGDSIWRIASNFKVDQAALMKANGISDVRKMKTGMSLVIPR